jgi:hypothetical protein
MLLCTGGEDQSIKKETYKQQKPLKFNKRGHSTDCVVSIILVKGRTEVRDRPQIYIIS